MKRLSLTILFCFLLSGCIFDPVFDTSSWDAFQQSANAIRAKLGNDDLRRLDIALKYLLAESTQGFVVAGPQFSTYGAGSNGVKCRARHCEAPRRRWSGRLPPRAATRTASSCCTTTRGRCSWERRST